MTFGDGHDCTALHLAVKAGSLNTAKVLLNCLLPSTLEHKDSNQNTPLHVACMHNNRDVLKFLLDQGADVTARNIRNMTCLDVAIEWEAGEVAKTLLRHKRYAMNCYPLAVILDAIPPFVFRVKEFPSIQGVAKFSPILFPRFLYTTSVSFCSVILTILK